MKFIIKKNVTYFLQGLFALMPILITVFLFTFLFQRIESVLDNFIFLLPKSHANNTLFIIIAELLIGLVLVFLIYLYGILIRTYLGKKIQSLTDKFFGYIPLLGSFYHTTKQVADILTNEKNLENTKPVLVEFPSPGLWSIAFNTGDISRIHQDFDDTMYSVLIPTTPNPTTGYLVIVPGSRIKTLDISVEEAIKIILTGGVIKHEKK